MANHKLAITNNLLSFSKISNITLIINSTWKISCPLFLIWSSWDYCIIHILCWCYSAAKLFDVTLDYWLTPFRYWLIFSYWHQVLVEDELGVEFSLVWVLGGCDVEIVGCVQTVDIAVVMTSFIKQFSHILDLLLSTIECRFQLLFPYNGYPVDLLNLKNSSSANITTRLGLFSNKKKRYISNNFDS